MIEPLRTTAIVARKKPLTEMVYEVTLTLERTTAFIPGQYIQLWIQPALWRIYSIVEIVNNEVVLLIDLRPGGDASRLWPQVKVGDTMPALLPMGTFAVESADRPIFFLTTGTGIAPCLPMIRHLVEQQYSHELHLLFGTAYQRDDFVKPYLDRWKITEHKMFTYTPCYSQEKKAVAGESGRVGDVLSNLSLKYDDFDYYICGSPQMVTDTVEILKSRSITRYFYEKY